MAGDDVQLSWRRCPTGWLFVVGLLLALLTVALLSRSLWSDRDIEPMRSALAAAVAAMGVLWLGNARYLFHGNESVHGYLLTASLAGALLLITHQRVTSLRIVGACLLAFVATFSFGPGFAVFPALAIVLFVQGRYRSLWLVALGMVATLVVYFLLPGSAGVSKQIAFSPLATATAAAIWLCSAPVHLFQSLFDSTAGRSLPWHMYSVTSVIASGYEAGFGNIWRQHRYLAIPGMATIAYVTWASIDCWRSAQRKRLLLVGLGIAWFAIAAAGIVALARTNYFLTSPEQTLSNRFLPWSCLFWLGVGWIALARSRHHRSHWLRWWPLWPAGLCLVFAIATSRGYSIWGEIVQRGIRSDATGIAVGVLPDRGPKFGETYLAEVIEARPLVKKSGVSMFAWPESKLLGSHVAGTGSRSSELQMTVEARNITNTLEAAQAVELIASATSANGKRLPARLLALDANDVAIGILSRIDHLNRVEYRGYAKAHDADEIARLVSLSADGGACHYGCR